MARQDDEDPWPHEPDPVEEPETGWPDEPSEFDPGELGPSVPSPPEPGEADNPEAVSLFWWLVVVFNVALLALSLGAMFVVFRGAVDLGLQIALVGVLLFAYGTYRYHQFRSDREE